MVLRKVRPVTNQPLQLRSGEIGVDAQPRAPVDKDVTTRGLVLFAYRVATPALPDDGRVQRFARAPLEHRDRLALVGNADAGDVPDPVGIAIQQFSGDL